MRALMMAGTLIVATVEGILGADDLPRYAITQGGLLIVVLVLLWMQRRDNERISKKDDEKLVVLIDLIAQNTVALTNASAAAIAQEKAADRLAKAVEHLEGRL